MSVRYLTSYNQAANVPELRFDYSTAANGIDEKMLREMVEVLSTQLVPGMVQWSVTEASNGLTTLLISPSSTVQSANKVEINSAANFPAAVAGVRTLTAGNAYQLNTFIDLEGDRLVCAGDVVIYGTSSETAGLTSTGLDANTPLITSPYSLPMQNLRIYDVGYGVEIDGTGNDAAQDWLFVNFVNVPKAFDIRNVTNWIGTLLLLSGSGGILGGTVDTIGLVNSLIVTPTDGTGLTIEASAVISRRARISYTSIVTVGASSTGINFSASATIPVEGYILDTVNFSGAGTVLAGVQPTDDKSLAVNCTGIVNSSSVAMLYMLENALVTSPTPADTPVLIQGVSQVSHILQRFTLDQASNGLIYTSSVKRVFYVRMSFTFSGGNNKIYGFYIAKKPSADAINPVTQAIPESEVYLTANGARPDTGFSHALVELGLNDIIYPVVESLDASTVTIQFLNMIPTVAL